MLGTPIRLPAARDLYSAGLKIVSTDRYGKADNTDRLGHAPAGIAHAKRGWEPHTAASGPAGAPVYVSIDDDPSHDQDKRLVATYLRAREPVLGHWRAGRLRELQDHRLRRCRTAPGRTAGSTTSARPRGSPIRQRSFIRSESPRARSPAWARSCSRNSGSGIDRDPQTLLTSKICQQTFARHFGEHLWTRELSNRLAGPTATPSPTANFKVTIR